MNVIIGGYARALNKIVDNRLGDDYVFAVNRKCIPGFMILVEQVLDGKYIESLPGETYHPVSGTDITIFLGGIEENHILIPAHRNSLQFFLNLYILL